MNNSDIEKEYQTILPLCESFVSELKRQLNELLAQEKEISSEFIFQHRVKPLSSILQTVQDKTLTIKSVREFDDLIGLRVILTFKREAELASKLIRENLNVLVEKDTQSKLGEKEFGYSSIHFTVEPPANWQNMPTFKKVQGFRAEIQVRSGAQHIWASASRVLQYKQEQGVPPSVRRAINRVSALLELADLEFERVLAERVLYLTNARTDSASEQLNVDLLAKTLDEQLPEANKLPGEEHYAGLLTELLYFSINTPQKLRELWHKQEKAVMEAQSLELDRGRKEMASTGLPVDNTIERLGRGIFFTQTGLARMALRIETGEKWNQKFGPKRQ